MLTKEEVQKIAHLARLSLTPEEVLAYQQRLGRVLDYIGELNSVATNSSEFVRHVPKDAVSMREDRVIEYADRRHLLENAPASEENCFLVPTVVDHE